MNLSIHQYRVTPLRNSLEFHLGVGHGTRHDLFLPSLFSSPAPHPEGCIRWRASQLSRGATESPYIKNCLARPPLSVACFSVSLSSFGLHRVGVPRSIHESSPHVKLIFQNFCIFLQQFFKKIEKSMFSKITFLVLFQ